MPSVKKAPWKPAFLSSVDGKGGNPHDRQGMKAVAARKMRRGGASWRSAREAAHSGGISNDRSPQHQTDREFDGLTNRCARPKRHCAKRKSRRNAGQKSRRTARTRSNPPPPPLRVRLEGGMSDSIATGGGASICAVGRSPVQTGQRIPIW